MRSTPAPGRQNHADLTFLRAGSAMIQAGSLGAAAHLHRGGDHRDVLPLLRGPRRRRRPVL